MKVSEEDIKAEKTMLNKHLRINELLHEYSRLLSSHSPSLCHSHQDHFDHHTHQLVSATRKWSSWLCRSRSKERPKQDFSCRPSMSWQGHKEWSELSWICIWWQWWHLISGTSLPSSWWAATMSPSSHPSHRSDLITSGQVRSILWFLPISAWLLYDHFVSLGLYPIITFWS